MSKYRSAMDKIRVTPEMEERILKNIAKERSREPIKKTAFRRWARPVGGAMLGICAAAVVLFVYLPSMKEGDPSPINPKTSVAVNHSKKQAAAKESAGEQVSSIVSVEAESSSKKDVKQSKGIKARVASKEIAAKTKGIQMGAAIAMAKHILPPTNSQKDGNQEEAFGKSKVNAKQFGSESVHDQPLLAVNNIEATKKDTIAQPYGKRMMESSTGNNQNTKLVPSEDGAKMAKVRTGEPSEQESSTPASVTSLGDGSGMSVMTVNPIKEMKDLAELKKEVDFKVMLPKQLPDGYAIRSIALYSGKMVQIRYSDGVNEILYRTESGSGDISGDYTEYEKTNLVKAGADSILMKGDQKLIKLATWTHNGYSYSLSFSAGIELEEALSLISSITVLDN